ncbi:hypothetical protein ANANG_G00062880 [Anguilla anguilla]|uniref:Uncharacterized protein n=1 Tax=Anguilla anguilla TaxID=7936 RepID=A0A9D3MP65_ANGAN|nr:hypothetical protein ANANG_G00062880 [Anguilla anguilla]
MAQNKTKMFSRGKLGEGLGVYRSTPFNLRDTSMPEYNSLHDPHLCNYYQRKSMQKLLRERNLITEQNEVICSMQDVKIHNTLLQQQLVLSQRSFGETQKAKMMAFLKDQEKGLASKDMTLTELREIMLEEELKIMRKLMRSEVARERKYCKGPRPIRTEEEESRRELELMSWKVAEREVLRRIECDARHEYNLKKIHRETQERRERQKVVANERKNAFHQKQRMEKLKTSEASVARELANLRRTAH